MRKSTVEKYYNDVYYLREFDMHPALLSEYHHLSAVKREYVEMCLKEGLMFRSRSDAYGAYMRAVIAVKDIDILLNPYKP